MYKIWGGRKPEQTLEHRQTDEQAKKRKPSNGDVLGH